VKARPHKDARNLTKDHKIAETVSRLRQRLDAIFEDAMFHGKCRTNPAAAIKRKLREEGPKKKAGNFAALDYAGAPALMERIRAADGVSARCLEFAVLTAARTTEALEAEWSEIDLRTRTWTIPAERMKADEPHVVYLSDRAVEILKAQKGSDECVVFPTSQSSRKGKPMSNMALLAVLERLGVRHLTTVHGLCRATFSTWANETAAARREVIEACLAHREADQVAAAYNRAQFNAERKALLAAWSTFLSPDGEAAEHATVAHLVAP
jgi:integrase